MESIIVLGIISIIAGGAVALGFIVSNALKKLKQVAEDLADMQESVEHSNINFTKNTRSMTHMGSRIVELESQISQLKLLVKQQREPKQIMGHYHQARKIVNLGGDEIDLVKDCGLTRIEAQMIRVLQAKTKNTEHENNG